MSSLAQVAAAMQTVLTEIAEETARSCGFVRRRRVLSGAAFVQGLVLGFLAHPTATLHQLTQTLAALGAAVSPQALAQRFTPQAAALLEQVLAAAVGQVLAAPAGAAPLLARFTGVYLLDSTTVALPDALAAEWPGCGGRTTAGTQAAVKLQVRLDLVGGGLDGPTPTPGRAQDKTSPWQEAPLPPEALRLTDLGFWSLDRLRQIGEQGAFWLTRLQARVGVYDAAGDRLDLPTWLAARGPAPVDAAVTLGAKERLPARLLAARVPQPVAEERRRKLRAAAQREGKTPSAARLALADWTLFVTNAPAERLSVAEALVLGRARWQIELLFKLWKRDGRLDESRSAEPQRVLCELYAKLLALVIQHWVLLVGCWAYPDRSLVQAAQTVRAHALCLVRALPRTDRLLDELAAIRRCLTAGCRLNTRKTTPSTAQLLRDPALGGLT